MPGYPCCCGRHYCWYLDEDDTENTVKFVRMPAIWWSEMAASDSTIGIWEITASAVKEIGISIVPGYLYTEAGDIATERVWAVEHRAVGSYNSLTYYDCCTKDELKTYTLVGADNNTLNPDVLYSFFFDGGTMALTKWEGVGTGYNAKVISGTDIATRGTIEIDGGGTPSPADGEFITHKWDASPDTIVRTVRSFDLEPFKDGVETRRWDVGDYTGKLVEYYFGETSAMEDGCMPQCISPRMWPMAAGFRTTFYAVEGFAPINVNYSATIYPESVVYGGMMVCTSGSPGDLKFPYTDPDYGNESTKIYKKGGDALVGALSNLYQGLGSRYRLEVLEYDCSKGGYIVIIKEEEIGWGATDIDIDDPLDPGYDFATSSDYYVSLFVGEHGADEPAAIQKYTSNSGYDHLWGDDTNPSLHAIHKHKDEDDYWLFAVPFRATTSSNYRLRIYKIASGTASLHWESPVAANSTIPKVLWSSDKWIYVKDLSLSAANVLLLTRGKYNQVHDDWLISHDEHDHPTEAPDYPYYVPLGDRDSPLTENWTPPTDELKHDTICNSRLLPYVPPAFPF